jgi:hypothetical protein
MKKIFAVAAIISAVSLPSLADYADQRPISSGSSEKATRWYTGLIWEFGGSKPSMTPDLVLGVRRTTTKNIDSVSGTDASIRIGLGQQLGFDSVRLSYVDGKPSLLGQVGAGYSFKQNSLLLTGALQGAYVRLSTDYLLNEGEFQFFGELNTLQKPKKAGLGELSCPAVPTNEQGVLREPRDNTDPAVVLNGFYCEYD